MGGLFGFSGRMGRAAYCVASILSAACYIALYFLCVDIRVYPVDDPTRYSADNSPLFFIGIIVLTIVGLSFSTRRWHDLNKSGWWLLFNIIPIVGSLYSFVMLAFVSGTVGPNRYGDKP